MAWSPMLERRALREQQPMAQAEKQREVARLLCDERSLKIFDARWATQLQYFRRGERIPQIFARDPEAMDAAVIELRATIEHISEEKLPSIHGTFRQLEQLAERTRIFRQQCYAALQQEPVDA
ncbi:MAG: hypothetical protein ABIG71_01980 [Candidatus Uhrbacteria bacterium]